MRLFLGYFILVSALCVLQISCNTQTGEKEKARAVLNDVIVQNAEWAMQQEPLTVTASVCERSAGGIHDFYSEGDYWWPDTANLEGPYIRRDGETNPDNFVDHRLAMIRFSKVVGSLASAYITTGNGDYARHAFKHINAWFTDTTTMMNPNLLYAQAIKGITTGRGVGIIDTIHLMEVAQGIICMQNAEGVDKEKLQSIRKWFADYIAWLTTHKNGIDEMNAKNNHGTCWVMQVASFAKLTEDKDMIEFCKLRYKNVLLPNQMADDGSFPLELSRTKPYGYALFNLDAMATICQILSTPEDNLWEYITDKGLNIRKGIDFMYPYIKDKSAWTYPQDIMYWNDWPVAQPSLIFGAVAYNNNSYFNLWQNLSHTTEVAEVERNLPIRNPLIWL
ncbi:MAG: alginate lyase family protein [Dysgonomonas sp.]|nr:alginate lyase family protein [Dysgonomonas sp.]